MRVSGIEESAPDMIFNPLTKHLIKRNKELEAQAKDLCEKLQGMLDATANVEKRPYLLSVDRVGRLNKFMFMVDGKIETIETMGLISDDIRGWKKALNLE